MMVYEFSGVQQTDRFMDFVGSANRPLWRKSMENGQQTVSKETSIIFYYFCKCEKFTGKKNQTSTVSDCAKIRIEIIFKHKREKM